MGRCDSGGGSSGGGSGGDGGGGGGDGGSGNGVAGGAKTVADHRADVVQFYTEHNPEKLAHIDQVMGQFRGREDQIVPILKHKYGVAP